MVEVGDTAATVEVEGAVAVEEVMEATALVVEGEVEVAMDPRDGKDGLLIHHVEIVEGEMGEVEFL